jgi:hypothetical protein
MMGTVGKIGRIRPRTDAERQTRDRHLRCGPMGLKISKAARWLRLLRNHSCRIGEGLLVTLALENILTTKDYSGETAYSKGVLAQTVSRQWPGG